MDNFTSAATKILGERIRECRVNLGLSQEDVAHLAAMHVSNFGKIERGVLIAGLSGDMVTKRPHKLTAAELIRARQS